MSSFGLSGPVNLLLAFIFVLVLIGVIAWAVRRVAKQRLGTAARARQPRLAVLDTAAVDARRQLVIIRRDNVEHLLMIGGGSDLVIETNIVRGSPANAGRDNGRTLSVLDAPRTAPVYEGTSWPAPQPETSARLQRTYPLEEPTQWAPSVQPPAEEPAGGSQPRQDSSLRAPRSARAEPPPFAPSASPSREPTPSAGSASSSPPLRVSPADRPVAADASFETAPNGRPEPPPVPMVPPVATVASPAPTVPQRPDMLQRPARSESSASQGSVRASPPRGAEDSGLPLASREPTERQVGPDPGPKSPGGARFSFPNVKFDRSPPPAPNPARQPPPRTASANAPPPATPAKPKTRALYESLEQEMASLLGKPPEKS